MQDWERAEFEEQIGQAGILIKRLLQTPEDCDLRNVCEGWLNDHQTYMVDSYAVHEVAKGYDISKLDGDENNLRF